MELQEFILKVKSAKKGGVATGGVLAKNNIKLKVNAEKTIYTFFRDGEPTPCRCCGAVNYRSNVLKVEFTQSLNHFSVFEAELLYLLYIKNTRPLDYAQYHKCVAGQRFIENIKQITIL